MHTIARQMTRPAALFASLCLAALVTPVVRAQQEARPTQTPTPVDGDEVVRITTDLVQTDVMVFDKQGKFVDGLKADQFELKVDGKPQAVTFFERIKAGAVDEDAQLAAARGGATRREGDRGGVALPLDRGRTIFFFVDDIHMSPGSLARVQKTLLKFIEQELGQNDEAAVISATGQPGFLQQLTDEKAVLRAAVARLKPRTFVVRDLQSPPMSVAQALAIDRHESQVLDFFVEALLREMPGMSRANLEQTVTQRARSIIQQSNLYNDNTLSTLENLVRGSAPLPGRKLVFFISDGFLMDTRDSGARTRMQSVTDAAARSGVVIYSLGAQGLTSGGMGDASTEAAFDPSGRLASTDLSELRSSQEPLITLAADTGGRALVNTNSLDASVERALAETAVYYLLAWRPEGVEPGAPKFRRIEASVKGRDDLRVIVRKGFYDLPPEQSAAKKNAKKQPAPTPTPPAPAPDKELMSALRSRHPRASFPTSLALGYVSAPGQGTTLTASVGVDRELLARRAPDAKDGARVDVAGAVYNDKGDPVSAFKQELAVRPVGPAEAGRHSILYSHSFGLAPGLYQVRVATLERQTGRAGSAAQWVEVPALGQGQFAMSSLFIGERPANGTAKAADGAAAGAEAPGGVLMSVDGRFARNSAMRFVTYVYNAKAGATPPDVALQVQIFRDDQPVFTAPLIKVRTEGAADLTRIPYAAELSLASFPPGRYMLQITAIDRVAKASTTRRVKFVIE